MLCLAVVCQVREHLPLRAFSLVPYVNPIHNLVIAEADNGPIFQWNRLLRWQLFVIEEASIGRVKVNNAQPTILVVCDDGVNPGCCLMLNLDVTGRSEPPKAVKLSLRIIQADATAFKLKLS